MNVNIKNNFQNDGLIMLTRLRLPYISSLFSTLHFLKQLILITIIMMFVSNIALAIEEIPSDITELYVKSGLKRQVDSFTPIILAQIQATIQNDPGSKQYKPNEIKKIVELIRSVFNSPNLKKLSLAVLSQDLTRGETKKLLDWFSSATGKKVAWYEDHISTPAGYLEIHKYEKAIAKKPPTVDYQNAIQKLSRNMKVLDAAVDMALVNEVLVNSAMASLHPKFTIKMLDDIKKQTERNKSNLKKQVSEYMNLPMLFTYSFLSKKELGTYLEFTSTPLGKKYFSVMVKALNVTFRSASIEFGEKILRH